MKPSIYSDRSIRGALARVKEDLGPDALILSTRKVPKSPRDPYAVQMFEVEAVPKGSPLAEAGRSRKHRRKDSLSQDAVGPIHQELISIRDLISIVGLGSGMQTVITGFSDAPGLFASLLRTGMSERLVQSILQAASAAFESNGCNTKPQGLKAHVIQECMNRLDTASFQIVKDGSGGPYLAAFVGPTGVGKTTTIAKLAAELAFKQQKKVGLISIDSYRIAAFDQLKAYAGIMGLMCLPAYTRDDFVSAVDRMRHLDVILVDTAGHSHSDTERMVEIQEVFSAGQGIAVHLVLSVTTGTVEMQANVSGFKRLNPVSYVFTKVDETGRCGKIMDQINSFRLPVSLVTNGQRVPEDLILPDRKQLLRIILGAEQQGGS